MGVTIAAKEIGCFTKRSYNKAPLPNIKRQEIRFVEDDGELFLYR